MGFDRKYLVWALSFAIVGMCLGIFMAASHDHRLLVAHAHILLVGFVVALIYAVIHKLWLAAPAPRLALAQFAIHQFGAVTISVGLVLLYGGFVLPEQIDLVLAIASISVLIGAALMLYMVIRTPSTSR